MILNVYVYIYIHTFKNNFPNSFITTIDEEKVTNIKSITKYIVEEII